MLSLSNISAAKGKDYYKQVDSFSGGAKTNSRWMGKGAKLLGLNGSVERDSYLNLMRGQQPCGTARLPGRYLKAGGHRAALDMTFSAPKSVSIAALVGGERGVEEAHRRAVQTTLEHIETYHAQARLWDGRKQYSATTGNLVIAQFHCFTSRALDPQLLTHCVAISSTQCPEGNWKALTNESIYRNSKLLGSIYENELAYEVKRLGYDLVKRQNCLFEIAGYASRQIDHFSKRRKQILQCAGPNASGRKKQWATQVTRSGKMRPAP
ncbi:MAG: MobF family relaxase [Cyanobacteria bacterium P01_G01_bin.4]